MLSSTFVSLALGATLASSFPVALPDAWNKMLRRNNGGEKREGGFIVKTTLDPMRNTSTAPYPTYQALTDFDYASLNLGLYQEWIELDLFNYGLVRFSAAEFEEAGVTPAYQSLIQFMATQEQDHAQLLTNLLSAKGNTALKCTYNYTGAFSNVREYLDFNQQLTRWGESGVWGFLSSMNSRDTAQLLSESIATEARQQMVFRQLTGAFPMPVAFEPGTPQSWQWTLLSRYIESCPVDNPRIGWSAYPALTTDIAPLAYEGSQAAVATNRTANITPGQTISLTWEDEGLAVGPNKSYTTVKPAKGAPKYLFINSHINGTYLELYDIQSNSAKVNLPDPFLPVYNTSISSAIGVLNGTAFAVVTDDNPFLTPFNLTMINQHIVAGPAIVQLG